jgi:endonuclease YncB( thermonuclease family)
VRQPREKRLHPPSRLLLCRGNNADPLDVNAEMVRRGAAWVYRQYSDDPALPALDEDA